MRPVPAAIVPASIFRLADGSLYCERFGDIYASAAGAVQQARHVFLGGTDFLARSLATPSHTVVETGFGTGISFLTAWQAWRAMASAGARLHYVSVEKHPFTRAGLAQIFRDFDHFNGLSEQLLDAYPSLVPGFHRLNLDQERVTLTLLFGDAADLLSQLDARADSFFLDGFAPAKNPAMWSEAVLAQLARLAGDGARAASYTVAAVVRTGLEKVGFTVAKRPGFGPKRDMLVAEIRNGRPNPHGDGGVIVVGGGLAGTACAQRLSARGISLTLIERCLSVGTEASGNPTGILRPHLAVDWIPQVDLSLSAFLYGARVFRDLSDERTQLGRLDGVVHITTDQTRAEKIARTMARMAIPADVVSRLSAAEASEQVGTTAASGGWFYQQGGWVEPAAVCAAQLRRAGPLIERRFGMTIDSIRRSGDCWQVIDIRGEVVAEAAHVIIANAHAALKFEQFAHLPIRSVRGQLTYLKSRVPLLKAVCGDGYVTPALSGINCVGASYNEGLYDTALRDEDHAENVRRLQRILPDFCRGEWTVGGRVSFRTMSVDLLPVCGEVAPGLHAILALGSRGIALAPLLAEVMASEITGEPAPLARSLIRAMLPGRFAHMRTDNLR